MGAIIASVVLHDGQIAPFDTLTLRAVEWTERRKTIDIKTGIPVRAAVGAYELSLTSAHCPIALFTPLRVEVVADKTIRAELRLKKHFFAVQFKAIMPAQGLPAGCVYTLSDNTTSLRFSGGTQTGLPPNRYWWNSRSNCNKATRYIGCGENRRRLRIAWLRPWTTPATVTLNPVGSTHLQRASA